MASSSSDRVRRNLHARGTNIAKLKCSLPRASRRGKYKVLGRHRASSRPSTSPHHILPSPPPTLAMGKSILHTALLLSAFMGASRALPTLPFLDSTIHTLESMPGEKTVIAQMFEWNWESVAAECTNFLGPAGYGYVQGASILDMKRYMHPDEFAFAQ